MNRDSGYKTKQRDAVLSCLKNSGRCMSAEEIISAVGENVSKTTVYRALEHFVNEGNVTRFTGDVGQSAVYRYSHGHSDHCHLHCTECGATECVEGKLVSDIDDGIRKSCGFRLNQAQTVFYGICESCSQKQALGGR